MSASTIVAGIGDLTVDTLLLGVEELPNWGRETVISGVEKRLGGGLGNFALAASALGMIVEPHGPVGSDEAGAWVMSEVQKLGVPAFHLETVAGGTTSQTFAVVRADGERMFLTIDGVLRRLDATMRHAQLGQANVVYVTGWCMPPRIDYSVCVARFEQWKDEGRMIAVDLSWSPESWTTSQNRARLVSLLRRADILFMNQDELGALADIQDVDLAASTVAASLEHEPMIVIKLGSKGALVVSDGNACAVPTEPVDAADTVGAGDMFNAAMLYSLYGLGLATTDSARFACGFSGLALLRGRSRLPSTAEVLDKLGHTGRVRASV